MLQTSPNIRLWYLSGGMTKFGADEFDESNEWRTDISQKVYGASSGNVVCFNPNMHYNMLDDPSIYTDREVMNLDIYKLRKSELVIYNNNDPFSRGSMIELGIAWQMGIPIIGLNERDNEVHPWVGQMVEKFFKTRSSMLEYLELHYIGID